MMSNEKFELKDFSGKDRAAIDFLLLYFYT